MLPKLLADKNIPWPLVRRIRGKGIDVGVRYFLTDSDGRQVENPKYYERTLQRIKIEQKKLSRKIKGSKNWEKQRRRVG